MDHTASAKFLFFSLAVLGSLRGGASSPWLGSQPLSKANAGSAVVNYPTPSSELQQPGFRALLPQTVAAQCGESRVVVTVKRDLFGIGQLIKTSDVRLGSCGVTRLDDATQSVVFDAQLQECGSTLMAWLSNRILLSLLDDWLTQRTSNVYSLGDVVNIEASVDGTNHMPLRLFVDNCVATMVPDKNASPRYVFIDNGGGVAGIFSLLRSSCLVDAKVSGSGSRFMSPRVQNTKLQMRLDAFRFYSDARSSIYITCHLKVASASQNVDSVNKACSFTAGSSRWSSVDGSDQVCSCCNTGSCAAGNPYRKRRGAAGSMALEWEGDARIGPLIVLETLYELDAQSLGLKAEDSKSQGFPVEVLVLAGVVAAVALGCIAALAAVIYRRSGKPTA
ncbi:UNVERIFIED_CONTAM: hypothetical protein FKN15_013988 [Acipenser sinensis]